ncbi:hypothetical protein, partial [Planktothrix sp.]|uniref:hypothetical protein n=1 Tax=Planktothrix sp. TaxID=3088171 RepID=UPI0038D45BB7
EPLNGGTKTRCLTAWRRPIASQLFILAVPYGDLSRVFSKNFSDFLNNCLKAIYGNGFGDSEPALNRPEKAE